MDPITIGAIAAPIISGIGSFIGGRSEQKGQDAANKANLAIAREQMAFQERMANTSWQRGVADMRAAGINPMLAVSKGGASAPTGSTATMQNPNVGIARGISQAATSASNVLQTYYGLKQLSAEARKSDANATVAEAGVPKAIVQAEPYRIAAKGLEGIKDAIKDRAKNPKSGKDFPNPLDIAVNSMPHARNNPPVDVRKLKGRDLQNYQNSIWYRSGDLLMDRFAKFVADKFL